VTVEQGWACLTEGCYAHGEGPNSDRQAERHGKAFQHGTHAWSRPISGPATSPGAGTDSGPVPTAAPPGAGAGRGATAAPGGGSDA
jgi:hypothetical protein